MSFGGQPIPLDQASISGSLFGPAGEEAGFIYGLIGGDLTVSGAAIGTR